MPRYPQLDFLRGLAILGILLLNIVSFALPSAAYLNPAWQGPPSQADTLDWMILDLFAELKFLSIFALLFGAGLVFQLPRGQSWLLRRLGLLMTLGLVHGLLLWEGDILLAWGITGLFACRLIANSSDNAALLRSGVVFYLFGVVMLVCYALMAGTHAGSDWLPQASEVMMEQYLKLHGGWLQVQERLSQFDGRLLALFTQYGWELIGLMLAGAALTRNGWLIGQRSRAHYWRCAGVLLGIGGIITAIGTYLQYQTQWSFRWSGFWLQAPRELGAPLMSLGYIAMTHALWPWLSSRRLCNAISRVGKMALSNYILQTLICLTLFSWGGLFLQFSRWQLTLLVPFIASVNLIFSWLWLRHYRQGPLEWGWRYLTQWLAKF